MPTEIIALVGAGGHSLVVIDALLAGGGGLEQISLFDQDGAKAGQSRLGVMVEHLDPPELAGRLVHICIGSNAVRRSLGDMLTAQSSQLHTIIHPAAQLAPSAQLGEGSFVAAGAIVAPATEIGALAIINHRAIVDHECRIGEGSHIAPGAVLGGAVTVGAGVLVGANATVLPGIRIGDGATIGAGAVVVRDVPAGSVVAGVPAREMARDHR